MVNPYDSRGMAHAIQQAFNMPLAERRERHQAMLDVLRLNSITAWHTSFVDTLDSVRGPRAGVRAQGWLSQPPSKPASVSPRWM